MINGKDILAYPHSIPNRRFEDTMINGKDFPGYPHNILNKKFEYAMISRKYFLEGGEFACE